MCHLDFKVVSDTVLHGPEGTLAVYVETQSAGAVACIMATGTKIDYLLAHDPCAVRLLCGIIRLDSRKQMRWSQCPLVRDHKEKSCKEASGK